MSTPIGPGPGLIRLVGVLNHLRIPYMIGGSLAASLHGIPRSTNDVDLIADIGIQHVRPLIAEVRSEFYIDPPEAIEQALSIARMFNLIHFETSYKFDIYPLKPDPYEQEAFARRKLAECSLEEVEKLQVWVESPEDAILFKLVWHRKGGEVSERQWNDVVDIVRVQRDRLDLDYLRTWASRLRVSDLLEEALRQ